MKEESPVAAALSGSVAGLLEQAAHALLPVDTQAKQLLYARIYAFPRKNSYITEEQFETAYSQRFHLPKVSSSEALRLLWKVKSVVADYREAQAQDFTAIKLFCNLFTTQTNAYFLNDNILRRMPHFSFPGRFQIVSVDNGKLKTLLTNLGSFACFSQFYGFLSVVGSYTLAVGVVSCEREWQKYQAHSAADVLATALQGSIREEKELFSQMRAAVERCDFSGRQTLREALETLLAYENSMDRYLSKVAATLRALMGIYEIPRFQEALDRAQRLTGESTLYYQFEALSLINQMICSYARNSNLDLFSKDLDPADFRPDFRQHLLSKKITVVPSAPEDLLRMALQLEGSALK